MTKLKICGLFRAADIAYVNEAKPDYIGFVFAKSRRQVTYALARALRERLAPEIMPVGVFVNAPQAEILKLYRENVISVAQLHGGESRAYIERLKEKGVPIIKAVRVESGADITAHMDSPADYLLLDNGAGGTGTMFDWSFLSACTRPYFLAGGVNLGNIADALALHPYCVDISSGAETDGVKDGEKIRLLAKAVRKV
ncbi:MAG TPA: phosphoribosylanthranilate isomerase [Feifaniaceae bacterium]|nr:phosphoribosylanthranilate isomerase [Feifaniaceae bacterium]